MLVTARAEVAKWPVALNSSKDGGVYNDGCLTMTLATVQEKVAQRQAQKMLRAGMQLLNCLKTESSPRKQCWEDPDDDGNAASNRCDQSVERSKRAFPKSDESGSEASKRRHTAILPIKRCWHDPEEERNVSKRSKGYLVTASPFPVRLEELVCDVHQTVHRDPWETFLHLSSRPDGSSEQPCPVCRRECMSAELLDHARRSHGVVAPPGVTDGMSWSRSSSSEDSHRRSATDAEGRRRSPGRRLRHSTSTLRYRRRWSSEERSRRRSTSGDRHRSTASRISRRLCSPERSRRRRRSELSCRRLASAERSSPKRNSDRRPRSASVESTCHRRARSRSRHRSSSGGESRHCWRARRPRHHMPHQPSRYHWFSERSFALDRRRRRSGSSGNSRPGPAPDWCQNHHVQEGDGLHRSTPHRSGRSSPSDKSYHQQPTDVESRRRRSPASRTVTVKQRQQQSSETSCSSAKKSSTGRTTLADRLRLTSSPKAPLTRHSSHGDQRCEQLLSEEAPVETESSDQLHQTEPVNEETVQDETTLDV
ncbi:serine/arginine repetitive matrix protein 2-like [Pollicipes pollicipes]|uniref:serine/arginine repetitive matrix protein 2-like n=1 Tax=Pollicipes pollicipes TaxID=41117 RepID=UPI0018849CA9|nr:serine/arginine repetitive matrix protein 2-like [Pollicipes pollicipes]